ncbi:MAG: hypothetical protein Q7U04_15960 [Bacteriovorax sp.]|nr:hypothetical protein [Bacteriovorax sp.]
MNRLPILALGVLLTLASMPSAFAGAKEDFVDAVVKQCAKAKDKAEELATPGRTGNIVKFSMCAEPSIDLGDGCKVTCVKSGSTIGG